MYKNKTRLTILTPNGIFFDDYVTIVTVKSTYGYIGIQPKRIPIIASIEISPLTIGVKGQQNYLECAIAGGILDARDDKIVIITDAIEDKTKIDLHRALKEKDHFKQLLKQKNDLTMMMKLKVSLQKALNRITVGKS